MHRIYVYGNKKDRCHKFKTDTFKKIQTYNKCVCKYFALELY